MPGLLIEEIRYLILIMNIISIKMLVYMDYITLCHYKEFMESHMCIIRNSWSLTCAKVPIHVY